MNITRHNYEICFIDYYDGKLNPTEIDGLMLFLYKNPDLKDDFAMLDEVKYSPEKIPFPEKSILKKFDFEQKINDSNFDQFYIAKIEGDLPVNKRIRLADFLQQNPSKQKEVELLQKTILYPDDNIVFPYKNSLKKYSSLKNLYSRLFIATAAACLLLFILPYLSGPGTQQMVSTSILNKKTTPIENIAASPVKIKATPSRNNFSKRTIHAIKKKTTEQPIKPTPVAKQQNKPIAENIEPLKYLNPIEINHIFIKTSTPSIYSIALNIPPQDLYRKEGKKNKPLRIFIKKPSVLDIADAGIHGINRLTGSNMELSKKFDDEGNLTELAFTSKIINFSKTIYK